MCGSFKPNERRVFFSTLYEKCRHGWLLILLLILSDADMLKQSKLIDHEKIVIKSLLL